MAWRSFEFLKILQGPEYTLKVNESQSRNGPPDIFKI